MSVSIKTDAGNYAINASRVEKFLTAQTREQALHMGAFDKFKDLFRAADEKKSVQIAKIYDAITSAGDTLDSPVDMAQRFHQLRDMAVDEAKSQFSIQSHKEAGSYKWSYSFSIGQDQIYQSPQMLDTHQESFESLSNYQKYFHGVDTVVAAPEGGRADLASSLQGVLHAMTLDSANTQMVLKGLAQAQAMLIPLLAEQDGGDVRSQYLTGYLRLKSPEDASSESDRQLELHHAQMADQVFELSKSDPNGVSLFLSRKENLVGDQFASAANSAIASRVDELPRQQLLSLHDFFKRNPYFAEGLSQAGRPLMADAVDDIDSNADMRIALFGAKAALINDLGVIANGIFTAVETGLQQDIYRTGNEPTLPWRVQTDQAEAQFIPKDLEKIGRDFLMGNQKFEALLSIPSTEVVNPSPAVEEHNFQLDPYAIKV